MPLNQTALSVIALTKPMFLCVSVNLSLSPSLSLPFSLSTQQLIVIYSNSQGNVTLRQPLFFLVCLSVCLAVVMITHLAPISPPHTLLGISRHNP